MTELSLLWNLAAYSAQVLCLVAGTGLVLALLRVESASVRHGIWRVLLLVCLLLPWLQGRQIDEPALAPAGTPAVVELSATAFEAAATGAASAPAQRPAPAVPVNWPRAALLFVAAGVVVRSVWLAVGLARLHRLRVAGTRIELSPDLEPLHQAMLPDAEVREVERLRQPVTFGLLKPVVLLPPSFAREAPAHQRAVLCHELLHARRRDWGWTVLEEGVRAVLWFHPAVWWLVSRVQLTREEVVDELAVRLTGSRRAYIEALMLFADDVPLARATAFARRRHLFWRIVLISKENAMSVRRLMLSSFAVAAVVTSLAWYATQAFPLAEEASERAELWTDAPPTVQVATPAPVGAPRVQPMSRVNAAYPPEAAVIRATGAVALEITLEQDRPADARAIGFALGTDSPRDYVMVQQQPLPPLDRVFPSDSQKQAAARAMIASAVEAVRGSRFAPLASSASTLYAVVLVGPGLGGAMLSSTPPQLPPTDPSPLAYSGSTLQTIGVQPPAQPRAGSPDRPVRFGAAQVQGGAPGPTADGLKAATPAPTAPAAPAPAPAPPVAQRPVRVGGNLKVPRKLKDVKPAYPVEAMAAGKQGIVIIEATIGPDGKVTDAKVLRSIPELDDAAVGAVKQWEFEPALLNGVPTPIIMSVTVSFTLKGPESGSGTPGPGAEGLKAATPAPTAPSAAPRTIAPVRVGGNIPAPRKIKDVKPAYPAEARAAGQQGIVILEVTIAPDGRVYDARILRSIPELDAAAVEAVKQWEFTPTLLNGQPVPVIMSVTVAFSLE